MIRQPAIVMLVVTLMSFVSVATAQEGDATPAAQPLPATNQTWSPEELEALLAPIALYPDPVLTQVLLASTNPQEVLDAGNWLVANPDLEGDALDKAAEEAGFTPPMRAVMPFRQIVDQMCLEMGWTTELGQAYTNDEAGVLAAVQRLRAQAQDVGTLQSSEQMTVENKTQDGQQVIVIEPPSPQIIYVPTYDPVAAYQPPSTNTTVVVEDKGPSAGAVVAAGVLSFGVGLAIGAATQPYYGPRYYPNYWGGYIPPPPPYYYRPVYGPGYYPSHRYNRTSNYNKVLSDNNIVVVNKNENYWGGFDDKPRGKGRTGNVKSPITQARPERADLKGVDRGGSKKAESWKGKSTYAGADPNARAKAKLPEKGKMPDSKAVTKQAKANASAAKNRTPSPEGDRGRGGSAKSAASKRPEAAASRPQAASKAATAKPSSRPQRTSSSSSQGRLSGQSNGASTRAASARGRSSMPSGARGKAGAAAGRRR